MFKNFKSSRIFNYGPKVSTVSALANMFNAFHNTGLDQTLRDSHIKRKTISVKYRFRISEANNSFQDNPVLPVLANKGKKGGTANSSDIHIAGFLVP
jgi:hypothetical protein